MNSRDRQSKSVPGGERIFHRIFVRLGCTGRPPQFIVEYHPYAGLTHTIRLRDDVARVRLSDVLRETPLRIMEATAAILLARLYRRKPPADLLLAYREFSVAAATRRKLRSYRRLRARPAEHSPAGAHHDLAPLFDALNSRYFGGKLRLPRLRWSARSWRSQLGCFDPALNQIAINRRLDRPRVPPYVVAYVLYHEMLHLKHPIRLARCRRESHSPRFRAEEKRFKDYARAMDFLKRFPAW
ncbi:MAG TPA: hypothetical protein VN661_05470 [Candidatus Acidoferrales bacterium]|nr:hypothetical protein [Candidatus Acidoferrales bacterium]